jgi:hypothetical protein
MDLCGPMQEKSLGGARYFLLLKDYFSYWRTLYFIKQKSDTCKDLEDFIKKTEKTFSKEFKNSKIRQWFRIYKRRNQEHHSTLRHNSPENCVLYSTAKWSSRTGKSYNCGARQDASSGQWTSDESVGRSSQLCDLQFELDRNEQSVQRFSE